MAEDEWSALDEELEKALSGKKGKKGTRDSVLFTPRDAIDAASSATARSGNAKPSGANRLDRPAVTGSAPVPPAVAAAPARAPGEALDEWRALDEELAKLERGKKRRGRNQNENQNRNENENENESKGSRGVVVVSAPHAPPTALVATERRRATDADSRKVPASVPVQSAASRAAAANDAAAAEDGDLGPPREKPDDARQTGAPAQTFIRLNSHSNALSEERPFSAHIVGTCDEMCPESERLFRERERELDVYEREENERFRGETASGASGKRRVGPAPVTSASLCVKRYARIVDDPSPDTVRTRSALERTTRHLYSLLGGKTDAPPAEWETLATSETADSAAAANANLANLPSPLARRASFLWDRLRGVRQDIALQNWADPWVMARLEEMVRFAIAAEYLLCEDAAAAPDAPLRREQLGKTLAALARCYRDCRDGFPETHACGEPFANEPEMLGYQLLLGMGADTRSGGFGDGARARIPAGDGLRFLRALRGAPRAALRSPAIAFALDAKRAYDSGHSAAFLNLATSRACSFLQACCLHRHVNGARKHALRVASATRNKSEKNADLFGDVGTRLTRLDARHRFFFANGDDRAGDDENARRNVTASAAAMTHACGLVVDEAAGTAALREAPFADPDDRDGGSAARRDARTDAFRPRRERFVDEKAPSAKGGFFRWRALIEGKVGR